MLLDNVEKHSKLFTYSNALDSVRRNREKSAYSILLGYVKNI
jgi:hypothetical protein